MDAERSFESRDRKRLENVGGSHRRRSVSSVVCLQWQKKGLDKAIAIVWSEEGENVPRSTKPRQTLKQGFLMTTRRRRAFRNMHESNKK